MQFHTRTYRIPRGILTFASAESLKSFELVVDFEKSSRQSVPRNCSKTLDRWPKLEGAANRRNNIGKICILWMLPSQMDGQPRRKC